MLQRLDPEVDLHPVARALALGQVAAVGPVEPLTPVLDRLESADLLSDEVRGALASLARSRSHAAPEEPGPVAVPDALSGEAYRRYRADLSKSESDAASVLRRLGAESSPGDGLEHLALRVTYLRRWYDALHSVLARQGAPELGRESEQRLTALVASRFPTLALKEGEFARLDAELQAHAAGPEARRAQDLRAELVALADGFSTFSRSLLAARG
jgi:hypothetical protein